MTCPVCNGTGKDPRGGGCFNCGGTGKVASAATTPEPLSAAELRDAIGDILDICQGWTRPMTPTQKVEAILSVATKAWENERD